MGLTITDFREGAMTFKSRYFSDKELLCHCGCGFRPTESLVRKLDLLREACGRPLTLTSVARCLAQNTSQGGEEHSYHMSGLAADVSCLSSAERYQIVREAMKLGFVGLGIAKTFVHIDLRPAAPLIFLY